MPMVPKSLSLGLLLVLAYQDYKRRQVAALPAALFFLLSSGIFLNRVFGSNREVISPLLQLAIGLIFLTLLYIIAKVIAKQKNRETVLGEGDYLVLLSLFLQEPVDFALLTILLSALVGIVFFIFHRRKSKKRDHTIPYITALATSLLLIHSYTFLLHSR